MKAAAKLWAAAALSLCAIIGWRAWVDFRDEQSKIERERMESRARQEKHAQLVAASTAGIAVARARLAEMKLGDAEAVIAPYATVNTAEMQGIRAEIAEARKAETVAAAEAMFKAGDVTGASASIATLLLEGHTGARALYAKLEPALDRERKRADAVERAAKKRLGVHIGMSAADVVASSWGRPDHINRTVTARGTSEQWVYRGRNYLYFENGVLVTIQN